jgi:hypothetical protein
MKTQPQSRPTVQEILAEHVTLTVECLDRLYLNGYVPGLQTEAGLVRFLVQHLKFPVASPALLGQITQGYVQRVEAYIQKHQLPVVHVQKGERKDKIARRLRRQHPVQDGVVFDRPVPGREFFEEVIRENLDLGRPERTSQNCRFSQQSLQRLIEPSVTPGGPCRNRPDAQGGPYARLRSSFKNNVETKT